ncbi:TauD/TfdA dioxygenase family protein [Zoogloea sp.]|uniref:TauD/TfdA dioxygenase family protein n=1 Tax=Zoogloea sp. TaxID=49181 RepID=UPI0035AED857
MSRLENAVPGYQHLVIEPYTPNIGATVRDIDLSDLRSEAVRAELRKALVEFQVLFFRQQTLTPEQHIEVAKVFGDPDKAKAFFPRHETQKVIEVLEARPGGNRFGTDEWHTDITFSANPPTGTVLYSRVVPPAGGDTAWASGTAVYESLPSSLRTYLEELEAVHSFEHSGWPPYFARLPDGEAVYRQARNDHLPVVHPVIRTHPVSGKKIVYVSPNFTDRIKGLSRQESDALLAFLFARFQRPEFQARLRWEADTVAVWDNRATVHYAVTDYGDAHRLLHRVTFGEDRAF